MGSSRASVLIFFAAFLTVVLVQLGHAEAATPSKIVDGKVIDLGIAYLLMLLALLVTYLVH